MMKREGVSLYRYLVEGLTRAVSTRNTGCKLFSASCPSVDRHQHELLAPLPVNQ